MAVAAVNAVTFVAGKDVDAVVAVDAVPVAESFDYFQRIAQGTAGCTRSKEVRGSSFQLPTTQVLLESGLDIVEQNAHRRDRLPWVLLNSSPLAPQLQVVVRSIWSDSWGRE